MKSQAIRRPSEREKGGARPASGSEPTRRVRTWTRRVHVYLGLYLLLFIWLFSISGLLLNHPRWEFSRFWADREETVLERVVVPPVATGDLAVAKELMRQLGIVGEVNRIERNPADDRFSLQVSRPGQIVDVAADLATGRAEVKEIRVNAWGVLDALHRFTGVSMDDPRRERDWVLTRIWSVAMDAVAVGLIVLVLSGLYLWYRLRSRRRSGLVVLGLGALCCGLFVFGLSLG